MGSGSGGEAMRCCAKTNGRIDLQKWDVGGAVVVVVGAAASGRSRVGRRPANAIIACRVGATRFCSAFSLFRSP
jgi:hypothetical protein